MAAKPDTERRPKRELVDEIKTRPENLTNKKGNSGEKIQLTANYFKLLKKTDWAIYHYRVDISPEEDRTIVRKSLIYQHKATLGFFLCDGTSLFTSNRYATNPYELKSIRREDKQPMVIKLKFVGDLVLGDAHIIQFFNIVVRKCLENMNFQLVGRNYWDAKNKMKVDGFDFEVWPGFKTSIRQQEQDLMMCADVSHKIMRTDTVYSNLRRCTTDRNPMNAFKRMIIGNVVITDYNNKTYRVDDVDFEANPSTTFSKKGQNISIAQYYQDKYNIKIRDMAQPLLVSRASARDKRAGFENEYFYLVPELCRCTGITDEMRTNFKLMQGLAQHTRIAPSERIDRLNMLKTRLLGEPKVRKDFKEWNFELDTNLIKLEGRVLKRESILYGNKVQVEAKNADWNFDMQNKPALLPIKFDCWIAVFPSSLRNDTMNFIQKMINAAKDMSIPMSKPRTFEIQGNNPSAHEYTAKLEEIVSRNTAQFIFVVVSNNQLLRYQAIKKKLCIDRPMPSQVVLAKTLNQKSESRFKAVGGKVAAQINSKAGGIPWSVNLSYLLPNLMVVGFDVCHTKLGKDFGATVASLDPHFGRYFSAVSEVSPGEELSSNFANNMVRACEAYKKMNGKFPDRIAIYRDGVGEGQEKFVYDFEVKEIKRQLARIYNGAVFKLIFIIVTKRINTRIFTRPQGNARPDNPPPGTVVDDVITNPLHYDFFIVSQSVNQGTVSPTAYNVIEDSFGLSPDRIQMMTYKLCHLYFNFSGTIRVPAPCQYAHKLAFFISTTLFQPAHDRLQSYLYFL